MGEPKTVGKIQVEEDLQFLKREWRLQRFGWTVIALLLFAGVLGAFGRGPLARAKAGDTRVFGAEYARVVRHGAMDEVKIFVGRGLQADSAVRVAISSAYLTKFEIEGVQPEPASQRQAGDFTVFEFLRTDARTPLRVTIKLRPEGYGPASGRIQLVGSNTLELRQFIMP